MKKLRVVLSLTLIYLAISVTEFTSTRALDLDSDKAALLALRNAVKGRLLLWNLTATDPCNVWNGVTCVNNRVTELRLPGMGLSGQLPLGLGNLTQLVALSLRFNALSGPIPSDFANLALLRTLFLNNNLFSGEIPGFLYNMQTLFRLNLAYNNFSGELSTRVNNLTRLDTLFLEKNNLSGTIPDINIANLTYFNVSFNRFDGSIPKRVSGMPVNAFEGNSLCGKPLQACPGSDNKFSGGAIAGIVIGAFIGFVIIMVVFILLCQKKRSGKMASKDIGSSSKHGEAGISREMAGESESLSVSTDITGKGSVKGGGGSKSLVFFGNAEKVFDLEDLLRASAEVLGKGTFGTTYKATLDMGIAVAVKRLKDVMVTDKEFRERIEEIGKTVHENLVSLKAYYYSRDERLLVYDYMPLGSVSALLHGNKVSGRTPLNWETRSSIALGAAQGIAFLHSHGPTISHGNIKSSNILLTRSYEARVSDFGLARLAHPTATPNRIDGYRAPEITDAHKVSQKADVYSFGVLLLELLTGKPPTHALLNEEGVDLPRWVQSIVREEWTAEVFDTELLRYQNVEEDMVQLLQIALECTVQYPDKRPSMAEVTSQIEYICRSSSPQEQDEHHDLSADDGLSQ